MPLLAALVGLVLSEPKVTASTVACETVAQCWLDAEGRPIARPKQHAGKKLPRGDCGKNLVWLRNLLDCQGQVCTATLVGDRC